MLFPAGFVIVLLVIYLVVARPFLIKKREVEKTLEEKMEQVKSYYSVPEGPPSPQLIEALKRGNQILEEEYKKVRSALYREVKIEIPSEQNPSLYYLETFYNTQEELERYASLNQATIPQDLGVTDSLPEEKEVPALLKRLYLVEWLLKKCIDSGIKEISSITFGEEGGKRERRSSSLYEKTPLTLTFNCDLLSLTKLLLELENSKERFILVEGLGIESEEATKSTEREKFTGAEERRVEERERMKVERGRRIPERREEINREEKKESASPERILKVTLSLSYIEWSKI